MIKGFKALNGNMIVFKHSGEINTYLLKKAKEGKSIGFVPTMGALHQGHISLIKESRKVHSLTVCSIFINPEQFNNKEDFNKYPVTLEQDIYLLTHHGCDVLFLPPVDQVYPSGNEKERHYDLGYLETILEGKYRPGHFQGVCKVVERLLKIVQPNALFIGQKDYQQCMVIKRLLILIGSMIDLTIVPTVRETDGLAMSSRNLRLTNSERVKAVEIFQTLKYIKENLSGEEPGKVKAKAFQHLTDAGFKVDYVEIADANDLSTELDFSTDPPLITLIAAYLNDVRLIDNMLINE